MSNSQPQVFVLGAVNIDYKMCPPKIPAEGELEVSDSFTVDAGGKANGQACALAKLGVPTYLISCIGKFKPDCDDGTGDLVDVKKLSKWEEIKLKHEFVIEHEDKKTGVTLIINRIGGGHSICEFMGVNSRVQRSQIDDAFGSVKPGDFFLTTYEAGEDTTNYALLKAKDKGMKTILSPAPVPPNIDKIDLVDYMVVYTNELEAITKVKFEPNKKPGVDETKASYEYFNNKNLTLIICLGPKDGAIYYKSNLYAHIESPKIEVVDTTLCRGAFIGGFVYQLTKKQDLENSLRFANCASAYCATKVGAVNALPYLKNVEYYMKQYQ